MNGIDPAARGALRTRARSVGLAAATLWLPTLVPLALGMLQDGDVVSRYLQFVPVLPGIVPAVLTGADGVLLVVVALLVTVVAVAVLYVLMRELPRRIGYPVQGLVMVLVALQSVGFAHALLA